MKNQVNSPELIAELEAIKQENAALKASFENVLSEKQKIEFNLGERMKELRCHNQISEILNENNLTINEVIEKIVQVLPAAMQFPEKATARISVYDFVFISPYFFATKNSIAREIVLSGEVVGQIEVCYPEVQLLPTEQIFLPEESDLLFSIAGRIGHFIERFQKDEALRQSETTYRKLVETINDVIYKIAADGTILYVSPAIERMLGYKPDELIGKSFLNFVYEHDRSLVSDKFSNLQKRDYDYLEYRLVTKSAAFCWVRSSTTPIYENGKFTGGTGTLTNITDQKIVEQQLQNSESLYRSILAASPDAITITDLEGKILFESPRAVEMFGYENAEELLGHPMLEYIDPAYHQKAINGITCMFQGTLLGAEEYKGFRKDGSTFDIEVNGEFIRDKAGQPQKMIFVTRDITHRKQIESALKDSEEKLRNLVNSQTNYVLRTDLEGRHTYWNRKFEEDFGWIYIEKGLDKSDSLLSICDYHHQRALDTVIKCLEEPGKIIKIELDKPVLHGEIRTTLWEFVCLTDSDNFPTEIQCMGIDIYRLGKEVA